MSNDTREALAAELWAMAQGREPMDDAIARMAARLAALTEQPAAPQGVQAEPPHVGADEQGHATMEWWSGGRKITVYPLNGVLLKSWGPNMESDMDEIGLEDATEVRAAFDWLYAAPTAPAQEPQQPAPSDDADRVLLREVFAVCEATEDECGDSPDNFARGRAFEAKRIRRGIGTWYQDTFCGRSFMGEPALAVPPTSEAVAELVEALTTVRPYVEYASSQFYDGVGGQYIRDKAAVRLAALDALIAKHGQPQGGRNG